LNFNKKVFIVGSSGISKELDAVQIKHEGVGPDVMEGSLQTLVKDAFKPDPDVGAVIVGFDEHIRFEISTFCFLNCVLNFFFSFPKVMKAATYLDDKSTIFIATNTDERFPMPGFIIPGTGAMVKCIETCAERKVGPVVCCMIAKN
jgi:phosphoglycolate phosphatase